jgi:integrase/recombinase XerC
MRHEGWTADVTCDVPFAREPDRDPAVLTRGELRALFEAARNNKVEDPTFQARDLAIVALLSQAGLRVHELVALDVDQVDLETRTLVAVRGKGGSIHDLPLNAETVTLLEQWLENRPEVEGPGEAALLVGSRGSRLSIRAVERLIAGLRANVTKKHLTPHTLRHTAATLALVLGCDVATVGDLLRHSSLDTTRGYLHLVQERKRDAVARLGSTIPRSVLPSPIAGNQEADNEPNRRRPRAADPNFPLDDQYPVDPRGRQGPRDN